MTHHLRAGLAVAALTGLCALSAVALAQDRLPWQSGSGQRYDEYRPEPADRADDGRNAAPRRFEEPRRDRAPESDVYRPPAPGPSPIDSYRSGRGYRDEEPGYGRPYTPGPDTAANGRPDELPPSRFERGPQGDDRTFSQSEIVDTGHRFFGSVSQGLASAVEYVFQQAGRPNGYILGEDAGGAFVAGLRYGEGTLFTKNAGNHKVYWQGPSIGYDFGGEGSKVMVLVYNLRDPSEIYDRFGGVQGSAYLVGGVGVQFQKKDDITLAPIRAGVGLRLGANVGYLKYTRSPTWNPF